MSTAALAGKPVPETVTAAPGRPEVGVSVMVVAASADAATNSVASIATQADSRYRN
jgi:hypothetical protein